ncbi:5191_t:CDS:2 [Entrophospora sp. SA101]|nr:5191_t:CDS:2 [Entrophospora sp. SA101]
MGNSSSTIIFQNFGNVNNIEPVCEAINIPGVKEFPKDSLEAQLYWIDQAALRFLTMNWTLHYKYPWNNNETVPDGATSHGAIQGTKWVDQNFGVAEVSDYLQLEEEIPKISTFANWITRTYAGWKKQMAEETLGASSLYI